MLLLVKSRDHRGAAKGAASLRFLLTRKRQYDTLKKIAGMYF